MLICLQNNMEHFSSLLTCLIYQALSNKQQSRESQLNDFVEVGSVFTRFKAVNATNCKKALQTGKNGSSLVGVKQLYSDVYKGGPFFGKVVVKDLLEDGDELLSNLWWGGSQYGQEAFSKPLLLIIGNSFVLWGFLARRPASGDSVLQVNNRCSLALVCGSSGVGEMCVGIRRSSRTRHSHRSFLLSLENFEESICKSSMFLSLRVKISLHLSLHYACPEICLRS